MRRLVTRLAAFNESSLKYGRYAPGRLNLAASKTIYAWGFLADYAVKGELAALFDKYEGRERETE